MKIELKHLAPYLPYGLHIYWEELNSKAKEPWIMTGDSIESIINFKNRPILRPLTDLTKEIEKQFYPVDYLNQEFGFCLSDESDSFEYVINNLQDQDLDILDYLSYKVVEKLFEWHFDVFGLIPEGLAIDINTL